MAEDGGEVTAVCTRIPVTVHDGDVVGGDEVIEEGEDVVGAGWFFGNDVVDVDAGDGDCGVTGGAMG